jgi:preprotein translocase subunit SecD
MTLEIHLRAGALPVKVNIVGSGSVAAALGEQFKTTVVMPGCSRCSPWESSSTTATASPRS